MIAADAVPPTVLAVSWGDVPSWISAGATVGGLIAAVFAAVFVYGQLTALREQNRLQKQVADRQESELTAVRAVQARQLQLVDLEIGDRRAAQARRVTVGREVRGWGTDQNIDNGHTLALTVTNGSHAPISHLTARYALPPADPEPGTYSYRLSATGGLAPTANGAVTDDWLRKIREALPVMLLEQGQQVMLTAHPRREQRARELGGIVRFTDADRRHWQVDEQGALTELPDRIAW